MGVYERYTQSSQCNYVYLLHWSNTAWFIWSLHFLVINLCVHLIIGSFLHCRLLWQLFHLTLLLQCLSFVWVFVTIKYCYKIIGCLEALFWRRIGYEFQCFGTHYFLFGRLGGCRYQATWFFYSYRMLAFSRVVLLSLGIWIVRDNRIWFFVLLFFKLIGIHYLRWKDTPRTPVSRI